ncbi:hypothetical protein GDO81_006059 [Engystomops pustulosus]|uniref:Uncharacterized protein n=1 Tax=Engystomops pustulosus TaxID=76066 RepID=A0AAV7CUR7_ENGPU|nr:hypothetical protein GDO81_006059 [Engystomops pustulosus]
MLLSRLQLEKFRELVPGAAREPKLCPDAVWEFNLSILYWIPRSLAPSTWLAYQKVWKSWFLFQDDWCAGGLSWVREEALICYVSELLEKGVSRAGVQRSLSALSFLFKLSGGVDDTQSFIAFFGAFRVGELVSPSKSSPGAIQWHQVTLGKEDLQITLEGSKTDRSGRGFLVTLRRLGGQVVCPVGRYEAFLKVHVSTGGSVFIHADGSPLTRYQFVAVFRKCIKGLGLKEGEYCSHSFHIGAATEAPRWGMSEDEVKRIGMWESRRFRSYVRLHRVER